MANPQRIADPNVQFLINVASAIKADYRDDLLDWEKSPFGWIKLRSSAQRGKIGKRLISSWLEEQGLAVQPYVGNDADYVVNGKPITIKFSTLWKQGFYKFQQIKDYEYDILICLGISPFDAHSWIFTKQFLLAGWGNLEGFGSQHGGQGGVDTAWIHIKPDAPQGWLAPHGGTLPEALDRLTQLLRE